MALLRSILRILLLTAGLLGGLPAPVCAAEVADRFAPLPFHVAPLPTGFGDDHDTLFPGWLAIPDLLLMVSPTAPAPAEISLPEALETSAWLGYGEAFGSMAGDFLVTDSGGLISLVKGLGRLKFWSDRRAETSLLADLGPDPDHWKIKVKAGPVPSLILRTSW